MTPSEITQNSAPSCAPEVPLLQGHLHPAVLLLRTLDALRSAALPLVLGVLVNRYLLVVAAMLFLLPLSVALIRYLTFQYTLTRTELRTREGLFNRQERRIPIDRVQDLGFEATILRRLLGITVASVETASGRGAEAVLDSLGRAEAETLRELLLQARQELQNKQGLQVEVPSAAPSHEPPAAATTEALPEWTIYQANPVDLMMRGFTDLRFGTVLIAAFAALQVADQLGMLVKLRFAASSFFEWLRGFPLFVVALLLCALVASALATSVISSTVSSLLVFHGFVLSLRGDTLLSRYGFFTRRQKTLPRSRVQRVTIEQTWLRRLLGLAVVAADSAATGRAVGQEKADGFCVVVPMAPLAVVHQLLPALSVGCAGMPTRYRRASHRLVWRMTLKGTILALLLCGAGIPFLGPLAALAFLLVPLAFVMGKLSFGNLGFRLLEQHLWLRLGVIGRYQAVLPTAKVQAVVLEQGPLQQILSLADLMVFVAGGSPTRLPDLTLEMAALLQRELVARGVLAAACDWPSEKLLPRTAGEA